MAIMKIYETTAAKLTSLPVVDGQMIFVRDSHTICMDLHGLRISYHDITTLDTEQARLDILAPLKSFYYVEETHVLWSYEDAGWFQLTPDNLNPVFFGELKDFPVKGSSSTLYVDDDTIYKWDDSLGEYLPVANMTKWDDIPE